MTPKERLTRIKTVIDGGGVYRDYTDSTQAFNADISEVEKALTESEKLKNRDTPMEPKMVDYTTQHFLCPSCNETISIDESKTYNKIFNVFCRCCGQRLDWSDEK